MKFQDDISNMNTYTHTHIHTYIRTSRNQYVPHFFKVGGIMTILSLCVLFGFKNLSVISQQSPVQEQVAQCSYEPRCEKNGLRGFRPGPTQTGLCSHGRWLEA